MDVVSIPDAEDHYRVLYDQHGRIALLAIDEDEANSKLARIEDKTQVPGGNTQLNLHDGRNVVVKEDTYSTGDVIRITLPDQDIADHFPLDDGAPVYVTGGTHIGQAAEVTGHRVVRSSAPNLVSLENEESFQTIEEYVFVVGADEPEIEIPEAEFHG
jgi:small subunit ribosomal protein S4e